MALPLKDCVLRPNFQFRRPVSLFLSAGRAMPAGSPLSSIVLIVKVLVRPGRRVSVSPGGCDLIRSKVSSITSSRGCLHDLLAGGRDSAPWNILDQKQRVCVFSAKRSCYIVDGRHPERSVMALKVNFLADERHILIRRCVNLKRSLDVANVGPLTLSNSLRLWRGCLSSEASDRESRAMFLCPFGS